MLVKSRFRFSEVFFGMLLAVAIFALGATFWSSPYPGPPTQTKAGAQSNDRGSNNKQEIAWWQDPIAIFTLGLVFIGIVHACIFYGQLRLIRKSLKPAQDAAEAAKLNAQAVMDAEGAHLVLIVKSDNLKEVLRLARLYSDKAPDTDRLTTPSVDYCFRNYGKTPAILCSVMHGMQFFETPSTLKTMHYEDDLPLEIIAGQADSRNFTVELHAVLTMAMAKAVLEYRSELLFFGQATFRDFFGRQFLCGWQFDGRGGGFSLIKYEERPDPDKKGQ